MHSTNQSRRGFLASLGATIAAAAVGRQGFAAGQRRPRILLRNSWQTVNIGDIGHTPGILQMLREHLPEAEVTLWPGKIDNGVDQLLLKNFPTLRIANNSETLKTAFDECDFLLHGSGASFVSPSSVQRWHKATGKPYGIYGITLAAPGDKAQSLIRNPGVTDEQRSLLDGAKFLYLRDGVSLQVAQSLKLQCPVVEFGPDGAFGVKLRNDEAATAFLEKHGLEPGKFLCVIPRLRNSPYWMIHQRPMTELDKQKHQVNEELKEADHAKVREAVIAFVRRTGMKVLVCPEDASHMAIGKEMIVDRLPEDVKSKTVWRENYWLTDEAVSTYTRALALLSMDMHSPIMAVANGTPAIYCRFWQQTSKGYMWRDIGLAPWLFNLDEEKDGRNITDALLAIAADPAAARQKVAQAMTYVGQRQRSAMTVLRHCLEG